MPAPVATNGNCKRSDQSHQALGCRDPPDRFIVSGFLCRARSQHDAWYDAHESHPEGNGRRCTVLSLLLTPN